MTFNQELKIVFMAALLEFSFFMVVHFFQVSWGLDE